jgi:GNAT superfamily N-acetyltransferase
MLIRFINPDEAAACNDFHNRIFGETRSLQQWRWGFLPHGFSADTIPFVAVDDNGKIVGTQAFIPIRMIDNGGVFWTVKSEETLVDPEYRGRQLFEKMYGLLLEYLRDHGLHCIWGFTAATKAFIRLGFQAPAVTSQLFFPFSADAIARAIEGQLPGPEVRPPSKMKAASYRTGGFLAGRYAALKFSLGSRTHRFAGRSITLFTLERPPADAGDLCSRFIRKWGGTTIYRDADYLRWRLFDNPYVRSIFRAAYDGECLLGWIAYAMGDDGMGYIIDLFVTDEDDRVAKGAVTLLLRDAVAALRRMGARGVRGWQVTSHPFDQLVSAAARRLGFYHVQRGYTAVLLINRRSERKESLAVIDSWYINRIFTEGVSG